MKQALIYVFFTYLSSINLFNDSSVLEDKSILTDV